VSNAVRQAALWLRRSWAALREITGDDAYDRYLAHLRRCQEPHGHAPLTRADFFAAEQRRKWNGVRRCC
jgi:uncharacterized short protein YbdD (DUF466 family)